MSIFRRLFGAAERERRTEELICDTGIADDTGQIVELDIVGESYCQAELARIAGPKGAQGKQLGVGVTLRCEPNNPHDRNAVAVEVMGLKVGHVAREQAAKLSKALRRFDGACEARGIIVGGWKDQQSEGHYGCRVWLPVNDCKRLGVTFGRPQTPQLPHPVDGEARLSASAGRSISTATVICEEHYQGAIEATRPPGWEEEWWPVLATFDLVNANPHAKMPEPCVEVRLLDSGATVGYLTPKISSRHAPAIDGARRAGRTPTAEAMVGRGTKGGAEIWRLTVNFAK